MQKKNFWLGVGIGVLVFVVTATTLFGFGLSRYNWDGPVVKSIVRYLPYSAMKVNRYSYSYYDYLDDLDGLKNAISMYPDVTLSEEEMKISTLQTALGSLLLEDMAARYGIEVLEEDYEELIPVILEQEGFTEEEFEKSLQETYGWDLETFKEKVVRLMILSNKLSPKISVDLNIETNKLAKETLINVWEELNNGADFAEMAETYSEDGSATDGGSLDWFVTDMMVEDFSSQVENLEIGEYSEVFTTEYGFHIVKLNDKRVNEETGETEYNASHIVLLGEDLDSYLYEEQTKADVKININGITLDDILY